MRRLINNVFSVIFTGIKFIVMKLFRGNKFKFDVIERFSPNVVTEFNIGSRIQLDKRLRVHSGTKIKVHRDERLYFGTKQ